MFDYSLNSIWKGMALALHVLVVEDDEFLRRTVTLFLNHLGHSGVAVENGQEALRALAKRRFDLVLMDLIMPVMDGLQTLAAIRSAELAGRSKLIVMLTGHAEPGDAEKLFAAGADGYLSKPLKLDALALELQRLGF